MIKKLSNYNQSVDKLLSKFKGLNTGIFVDNSNLYYSQKNAGWKIDLKKLKDFLCKYPNVQFYNFYIAIPRKSDVDYNTTQKFIDKISKYSTVKAKPVKYIKTVTGFTRKGDMDVEIVRLFSLALKTTSHGSLENAGMYI